MKKKGKKKSPFNLDNLLREFRKITIDAPNGERICVEENQTVTFELGIDFGGTQIAKAGLKFENRSGVLHCLTPTTIITKL